MSPLVLVSAHHPSLPPDDAFGILRDFHRHALLSDAVRSVELEEGPDGSLISHWKVNFRNGILVWSEFDEIDASTNTVRFQRRDGDPEDFSGTWSSGADPSGQGCILKFEANFEIGIPTLSEMLEPLAAQTLRENVIQTLRGIFGDALVITEDKTLDEPVLDASSISSP
jgi:hypothetical protein